MISTITVDGIPLSDTLSKAEALNNQFKSVFTHKDLDNIPTMSINTDTGNPFPNLPDISFSLNGIQLGRC